MIPHNSWIKSVRAHFPWSNLPPAWTADSPPPHPTKTCTSRGEVWRHVVLLNPPNFQSHQFEGLPWPEILRSPPVWGMIAGHFGACWGYYTLFTGMPTYFKDVLDYDIEQVTKIIKCDNSKLKIWVATHARFPPLYRPERSREGAQAQFPESAAGNRAYPCDWRKVSNSRQGSCFFFGGLGASGKIVTQGVDGSSPTPRVQVFCHSLPVLRRNKQPLATQANEMANARANFTESLKW